MAGKSPRASKKIAAKIAADPPQAESAMAPAALRQTDAITLYADLLTALNNAHETLLSPEMHVLMDGADENAKANFATQLLAVGRARLVLGNAVLTEIADALEANEPELKAGEAALKDALHKLDTVANVLGAVAAVASIAAKIVPLI